MQKQGPITQTGCSKFSFPALFPTVCHLSWNILSPSLSSFPLNDSLRINSSPNIMAILDTYSKTLFYPLISSSKHGNYQTRQSDQLFHYKNGSKLKLVGQRAYSHTHIHIPAFSSTLYPCHSYFIQIILEFIYITTATSSTHLPQLLSFVWISSLKV